MVAFYAAINYLADITSNGVQKATCMANFLLSEALMVVVVIMTGNQQGEHMVCF